MDAAFLIVIGVSLCFLSAMIAARMAATGARVRQIAFPIVELWLVLLVWILVFRALSNAVGTPAGASAGAELSDLASRLSHLPSAERLWVVAGLAASVGLVAHLAWFLRRILCRDIRI